MIKAVIKAVIRISACIMLYASMNCTLAGAGRVSLAQSFAPTPAPTTPISKPIISTATQTPSSPTPTPTPTSSTTSTSSQTPASKPSSFEIPAYMAWNKNAQTIPFAFDQEDLGAIVNRFYKLLGKNVVLPQGGQTIQQKVTFKPLRDQVTIPQAQQYLDTILALAGYTRTPHGDVDIVIKQDVAGRETLPLYILEKATDVPQTASRVRVVFYFVNLKVPDRFEPNSTDPISMILNDILSPSRSITFDQKANALIIADNGNIIATALAILQEIDRAGQPSVIELIPVYNIGAQTIVELLKTQILALSGDQKGALRADVKSENSLYFGAQPVSLVADQRTNSIIAMGSAPTLSRIRLLINELDQTPSEGRSLLHFYELQYLEAESFAPILEKILKSESQSGQSTKQQAGGQNRPFEDVVILAEKLTIEEKAQDVLDVSANNLLPLPASVHRGGNRLVITAKYEDWLVIRDLVQSLDKPEKQVIVEVMILDAVISENKILGTQFRNKTDTPLPKGVTLQAALLANPVLDDPAKTLASDLLRILNPTSTTPRSLAADLSSGAGSGSLIISWNDPGGSGIWGIFQVLDKIATLKVLSHPFLVVRNNCTAREDISEIRRNAGQALAGQAGVIAQKIDDIPATLRVAVVPRVSSIDRVSMQIGISISQFTSDDPVDFTRIERLIQTNANLSSGQVLVLGGLNILRERSDSVQVPVLSQIPVIGSLFQNNRQTVDKSHIIILMCPTVIDPKIRGGMEVYTRDKLDNGYAMIETNELSQSRDPIARWFFSSKFYNANETTDNFLSQAAGDFTRANEINMVKTQQRKRKSPKNRGFRI